MRPRFLAFLLLAAALPALAAGPDRAGAAPLAGRDVRDDVFYQFMPIAWRDSDNDASRFGDFGGMTASLPYLKSLGVTAVWMNPIFASPAYHGYQHMPANLLNPWFGTEPQFLSFVSAAHAESVKVLLDFVAYHVSQNSTYFQDSHLNPASPYTGYLAYTNGSNSTFDGGSFTTWNGSTVGFIKWRLDNPAVTALIDGWCQHWMDPNGDGNPADGIDGWRLDHVLANEGWGYTTAWWQQWKDSLLAKNPSAFTVIEQADWGSYGGELLAGHDAAFTIPFMFASRAALSSESASGLYASMRATLASLPAGRTYVAVVGNHDVNRLASSTGDVAGRNRVAAAILMTQPFPPCIYYGDELGMRGSKGNWGTDAVDIPFREPFKWNAVAGPPMSNYFVLNSSAYNARAERDNDGRSVQEQTGVPGSLLETYRGLIALRRDHVALRRGGYAEVPSTSQAVWSFVRQTGGETLLVAINLAGSAQAMTLDLSGFELPGGSSPVRDIASGAWLAPITSANLGAYPLTIPAYGWVVLNANLTPGPPPPPSPWDGRAIPADFGATALRATQTAATEAGDNENELDQLFAKPTPTGLAVGITGNLDHTGTGLALFFDTVPGGQDPLASAWIPKPPYGPSDLDGLGFDAGFEPDVMLWINHYSGTQYVDRYTLEAGGGGSHRYVGNNLVNGGSPVLAGGDNANGMLAAFCDSNTAGVSGSDAEGAASATFGFEAIVPWADLALAGPGTELRMMAAIVGSNGFVTNQVLPPLGPGAASPGLPPLSLEAIAGAQYATIGTVLSVPGGPPDARVGVSAAPNPFRDSTLLRFELPHSARVRVDVLDVSGRRVRALGPRLLDAGAHAIRWDGRDDAGRDAGAGLFFVRIQLPGESPVARIARLR
ncbi:MAG: alpha-glucosidase C-terminal domain-containing protein [Candidatus Eisenbacteria bacterium]|nr:alpha-glucosidase C-terminal domain-containing protein [Candidatus Eisenbacteria bacterium]